jgi:hypothetical protein
VGLYWYCSTPPSVILLAAPSVPVLDRPREWARRTPYGPVGATVAIPRETCPNCQFEPVHPLDVMTLAGWVDYFHCPSCKHVWTVLQHKDTLMPSVVNPKKSAA